MNIIRPVFAEVTPVPAGNFCDGGGLGPFADFLCKLNRNPNDPTQSAINAGSAFLAFATLISNIIGVFVVVAGLVFLAQFMLGGFKWLTAGGDKAKLESAQQSLLHAVIGLVIVLAAFAIVSLVGSIL
ncbi:hypothetical protein HYT02_02640, partial [Candidatus Gottesmanbacteria bacterium]|nr:hypothetical protein [Candidatus Gottesmanbacteria bacterium]